VKDIFDSPVWLCVLHFLPFRKKKQLLPNHIAKKDRASEVHKRVMGQLAIMPDVIRLRVGSRAQFWKENSFDVCTVKFHEKYGIFAKLQNFATFCITQCSKLCEIQHIVLNEVI
jgi:hypothetical protein